MQLVTSVTCLHVPITCWVLGPVCTLVLSGCPLAALTGLCNAFGVGVGERGEGANEGAGAITLR